MKELKINLSNHTSLEISTEIFKIAKQGEEFYFKKGSEEAMALLFFKLPKIIEIAQEQVKTQIMQDVANSGSDCTVRGSLIHCNAKKDKIRIMLTQNGKAKINT